MADGHADTAPGTLTDLAAFLTDNPHDEDQSQEKAPPTKTAPTDTPADDGQDTPDDEDAAPAPGPEDEDEEPTDEDGDKPEDEDAKDPTSERKHKVTVKGEDGADEVIEVPESELIKGYMRQADYSRKTQASEAQKAELAQKTIGALETLRTQHTSQLEQYARTMQRLAGVRSPEEMAVLAQNDPAAWVQEQQRERLIANEFARVQADIDAERAEQTRVRQMAEQEAFNRAWGTLGKQGIDKPKLRKIYDETAKHYGYAEQEFARVTDPRLVFLMRDAVAYRALKEKTAAVTQKAKEAPRLPPQRQAVPRTERLAKRVEERFKTGKAKLDDLAAYFEVHKL